MNNDATTDAAGNLPLTSDESSGFIAVTAKPDYLRYTFWGVCVLLVFAVLAALPSRSSDHVLQTEVAGIGASLTEIREDIQKLSQERLPASDAEDIRASIDVLQQSINALSARSRAQPSSSPPKRK